MAHSGDVYEAVLKLKEQAVEAFTALENDDDLTKLTGDLIALRDRASELVDIVVAADTLLEKL